MSNNRFVSVWDAIEDTLEEAETLTAFGLIRLSIDVRKKNFTECSFAVFWLIAYICRQLVSHVA